MKTLSHLVKLAGTVALLGSVLASAPVAAAPLFQVNEGSVPGAIANIVTADRLSFDYKARIVQSVVGGDGLAGTGDTFLEQGFLTKAAFGSQTGGSVPSQLNANVLGFGYGMYALFTITGEGDPFAGGGVLANFQTFNMTMYIDPGQNTTLSVPVSGPVIPGGVTSDDYAIVNYTLSVGEAHVFGGLANGDFDTLLNFTLTSTTPGGDTFFVSPTPFFNMENFGGNTETFAITSGDIVTGFTASAAGAGLELFLAVPEPGTIALIGIGLLGMILARRYAGKRTESGPSEGQLFAA